MEPLLLIAGLALTWLVGLIVVIWVVPALLLAAVTRAVDGPADPA